MGKTMPNLDEKFVRKAVIRHLSRKGYHRRLQEKQTDEHGVDIKVQHYRYARYFLVETKGDPSENVKYPGSVRENYFVQVLGQIMIRMTYKAKYKYGIGLPITYKTKVFKRLSKTLLKKFKFSIFLVDKNGKVKEINWKNFDSLKNTL
jgi:hypothetical protein